MRLFHVCTKKEFEQNGEKKLKWYKAGMLKISDRGRLFLRMFHVPEIDYHLFESERENQEGAVQQENTENSEQ